MKVLVIGSGGREHAICRALSRGDPTPELLVAPGNPGTATLGTNLPVRADDVPGLVDLARSEGVDLVVVGPEQPLVLGLADALAEAGIPCCGPSAAAARLEGSKAFTRRLAARAGALQPEFRVVRDPAELDAALEDLGGLPVVKADGLAAGKGVFLPDTLDEVRREALALLGGSLGDAGRTVVLEERLQGTEASLFYAADGTELVLLPDARDHKRLGEGDQGPNTGGMGAVSPNPDLDPDLVTEATERIVLPVLRTLEAEGARYRGFLYAGLMLTAAGPRLVEFNVRLGDPEAQAVLPRLGAGDLLDLCRRVATGELAGYSPRIDPRPTCAVVVASAGYPGAARRGDPIAVDQGIEDVDRWIDHAGTARQGGELVTAGGRVAAVVARAASAAEARRRAYAGVAGIRWPGMVFRGDIGGGGEAQR